MVLKFKTHTVESVTSGHPDKICDQISDALLDAYLSQDPMSRVAMECMGAHNKLFIGGEVTSNADINPARIARSVYKQTGHTDKISITTDIINQSRDIAMGVDTGGAGDQGIMYGYATDETEEFLPLGVVIAHKLSKGLEDLRKNGEYWIKPDGKSQVTITNGKVTSVVVSTQHVKDIKQKKLRKILINELIKPVIGNIPEDNIYTNPTGSFIVGGFIGDTGLTGRKIMVDTYGGLIPHGGGCFSGKDPTKVDRSGAYMARFVAKNLVAKGKAKKALVSVSYAIGKEEPLMIEAVNENGKSLAKYVEKNFDFRPNSIIEMLNLRQPIYKETSVYGHFGKEGLPWENVV